MTTRVLALRLAGPLQAWNVTSAYNRRETDLVPTKAGVLGLLAAAQGRRRCDPIEDLLSLRFGIRVDQPGSLLRDYHTVSSLNGDPLLSASVNAKGVQKRTSPKKLTHVTERFYLQDACFVAAVEGSDDLIGNLAEAVCHPAFPLFLGRRSCPPSHRLVIPDGDNATWDGGLVRVLREVPWQGKSTHTSLPRPGAGRFGRKEVRPSGLAITFDDLTGGDERTDVRVSFDPTNRDMLTRRVSTDWVVPPGLTPSDDSQFDDFGLLR